MEKFWLESGCKCPKMDNENDYPHHSYKSQDCHLHRLKTCEQYSSLKDVSYWCYPTCDPWWNDDDYGAYLCAKCGGRPYLIVCGMIMVGILIFGLVQWLIR